MLADQGNPISKKKNQQNKSVTGPLFVVFLDSDASFGSLFPKPENVFPLYSRTQKFRRICFAAFNEAINSSIET